jgi:hypothetical protein
MVKQIFKIILMFLFSLTASSCDKGRARLRSIEPSKFFKEDLKDASPDFQKGWKDGCESGMSGGTNSFNQMFYKSNKQDGYKFTYSPEYRSAWGNAFWFCYRHDYVNQKSTPTSAIFRGMP